jgi:hypothetical protein
VGRYVELGDGRCILLGDGVVGGSDGGVEGLGFAAGGYGCSLDDGGIGMREGLAIGGSEVEEDMQMREGGFLESE